MIFSLEKSDSATKARAGWLTTKHARIPTPVFMPVGTQASIKTLGSEEVEALGYNIVLANTYHLFLRPGEDLLMKAGGLHKFMSWPKAILTDSGGYQVFSMASRCTIAEEGVSFSSHVDGQRCQLTPESATRFQASIGSDIAMCFDDCPPYPSLEKDARASLERTDRWAKRCKESIEEVRRNSGSHTLLFGIGQGGSFPGLRKESSARLADIGFDGYALGGLGLGEPWPLTWEMAAASVAGFPNEAPHYLMGFGQPEDMWEGVQNGIDMFDCVLPTRNARNGQAFTKRGRLNITNAPSREDFSPLDEGCPCVACQRYTRAYLFHLFRAGEILGLKLLTLHNLTFMIGLLAQIREAIMSGQFLAKKNEFFRNFETKKTVR